MWSSLGGLSLNEAGRVCLHPQFVAKKKSFKAKGLPLDDNRVGLTVRLAMRTCNRHTPSPVQPATVSDAVLWWCDVAGPRVLLPQAPRRDVLHDGEDGRPQEAARYVPVR